jgi:hypothetical protein
MCKKIGWQKYEDMIKKQMSSPLASLMLGMSLDLQEEDSQQLEEEFQEDFEGAIAREEQDILAVPVPASFHEQLSLISNYDCWLGHTNFNVTPYIKAQIEQVEGVEVLKVCSRYRFFVGVGQMFKFPEVRFDIETVIGTE